MQVGFFDVIVIPMMEAWVAAFPEHVPMLEQVGAYHNYSQAGVVSLRSC
jgi:hypothetical protein